MIDGPAQHGLPGLVQMFGIESPGLTSSLSLAEEVASYLVELNALVVRTAAALSRCLTSAGGAAVRQMPA